MPSDGTLRREVAQTALRFAAQHIAPVAAATDHDEPHFPGEVFGFGVAAGFDRLLLPEEAGGAGFGLADFCSLIQTLAQSCAGHAMVFGVHAAALRALFYSGSENASSLIARLFSAGQPLGAVLPELPSPNIYETPIMASGPEQNEWILGGEGGLAINAEPTGFLILFANNSQGEPLAFLVQDDEKTIVVGRPELALGLRAMPLAPLKLKAARIPAAQLIAEGEKAVAFSRLLSANLSLAVTAAATGVMQTAYKIGVAYAAERYQGGKMIIDHSHLRSILGAMGAAVNTAEGVLRHAADQPDDWLAALSAKYSITEAAVKVCTDAVQVLGGYGYMRDFGLEKTMRDAATLSLLPVSNARAELLIAAMAKAGL